MVYRVYVEKKKGQTHEADSLLREIRDFLQISSLEAVRVLNRYDAENIEEALFNYCINIVIDESVGFLFNYIKLFTGKLTIEINCNIIFFHVESNIVITK